MKDEQKSKGIETWETEKQEIRQKLLDLKNRTENLISVFEDSFTNPVAYRDIEESIDHFVGLQRDTKTAFRLTIQNLAARFNP